MGITKPGSDPVSLSMLVVPNILWSFDLENLTLEVFSPENLSIKVCLSRCS